MQYFSTKNKKNTAYFRQATIQGQPSDKGLYFPGFIPRLQEKCVSELQQYSKEAIALEVIRPYVGDSIDESSLQKIISETVFFDFPLVSINNSTSSLELFHGPTLAFKDVGARFMSRCLG